MTESENNFFSLSKNQMLHLLVGILIALAIFPVGFFVGRSSVPNDDGNFEQIREKQFQPRKYTFINPLLGCNVAEKKENEEFSPLRREIEKVISQKITTGQAQKISIYFDTRDGHWLTINPTEKYFPASLLKVPVMIAYYKEAESNPSVLSQKLAYDGSFDINRGEFFKPTKPLLPNVSYTVEELIEKMIVYSDNNALAILSSNINAAGLQEIFTDLGLDFPPVASPQNLTDFMGVKSYANFFRVLYNTTYLNKEMSERALALMSKTDFQSGLRASLPPEIFVSHKFGEKDFVNQPQNTTVEKELHDCGIIYFPERPYILCVMTKGTDNMQLAKTIEDISRTVYQYIKNQ